MNLKATRCGRQEVMSTSIFKSSSLSLWSSFDCRPGCKSGLDMCPSHGFSHPCLVLTPIFVILLLPESPILTVVLVSDSLMMGMKISNRWQSELTKCQGLGLGFRGLRGTIMDLTNAYRHSCYLINFCSDFELHG